MKIQYKILIFLALVVLLFLFAFILETIFELKALNSVFEERKKEEIAVFDRVLGLEAKSLETLVFDYTYWDEMVDFIDTNNKAWAEKMMDASVLNNYKVNSIWIYKTDHSPAYSVSKEGEEKLRDIILPKENIEKLFLKERFCYFFMNTPLGLMEVRGATVHHTADSERKAAPQGYFFAGRLWDKKRINELSEVTQSSITLASPQVKEEVASVPHKGLIAFSILLADWEKKPLARINALIKTQSIQIAYAKSKQRLILIFVFVAFFLLITAVFISRTVTLPLRSISNALSTNNLAYIDILKRSVTEFGDISRLIDKFYKVRGELEISEKKYRGLYDSTRDGIVMTDMVGRILECNQAYLDMLGYPKEEILKFTYMQLTPEKWHGIETGVVQNQILQRGYSDEYEKEYIGKDGRIFPVSLRVWLIKDAEGKPQALWGIIRDITERKQKEKELEDAYNKLRQTEAQLVQSAKLASIGQLSSGVAHEINNPLTGVLNNIQLIKMEIVQKKDFNPADFKEVLDIIEESALRCKRVTQTLLQFSRQARGPFQFVFINEVIERTISLIEHEMGLEDIFIQKKLSPDLPHILGDPQLLGQVIFAIIANARWAIQEKPQKEGGLITIKTQYQYQNDTESVLISISDTGIGIPKENLDKIFEPFFTTKAPDEGTGLGLSISYNIIKQHKGAIAVESEINKGATFNIALPVAPK